MTDKIGLTIEEAADYTGIMDKRIFLLNNVELFFKISYNYVYFSNPIS